MSELAAPVASKLCPRVRDAVWPTIAPNLTLDLADIRRTMSVAIASRVGKLDTSHLIQIAEGIQHSRDATQLVVYLEALGALANRLEPQEARTLVAQMGVRSSRTLRGDGSNNQTWQHMGRCDGPAR
jgi:hypothetical protein